MNIAHDLYRVDHKRIVSRGNCGIISNETSAGSIKNIRRNLVEGRQSEGWLVVSVAGDELRFVSRDQIVNEVACTENALASRSIYRWPLQGMRPT
jgi:hypothetical protein